MLYDDVTYVLKLILIPIMETIPKPHKTASILASCKLKLFMEAKSFVPYPDGEMIRKLIKHACQSF